MDHRRVSCLILVIGLLLGLITITADDVKADVGVPPAQPASSLSPGEIDTEVQMVSEDVEIVIHEETSDASVTADFQMRNNGEEDEAIEVWFPFGERLTYSKGPSQIAVHDFQAWVDGEKQEIAIENSDEFQIFWAHWPVAFPAGDQVNIKVSYTVDVDRQSGPGRFDHYSYILETGAGWQGAIGEALITIQAPYPLRELDDYLGAPAFFASPAGYVVSGSSVQWDLLDLEPTAADNIDFRIFKADRWFAIRDGIDASEDNPGDWKTSYDLAAALHIWILAQQAAEQAGLKVPSRPNAELHEQAAQAYWMACELAPMDSSPYIGAIQYFRWYPDLIDSRDLQEIYYWAAERFPDNQQIQEYYQEALEDGLIGEGPPPSATPLPPTITPTMPPPTLTVVPIAPAGSGGSLIFPLLAGVSFLGGAALLIVCAIRSRRTNRDGSDQTP